MAIIHELNCLAIDIKQFAEPLKGLPLALHTTYVEFDIIWARLTMTTLLLTSEVATNKTSG